MVSLHFEIVLLIIFHTDEEAREESCVLGPQIHTTGEEKRHSALHAYISYKPHLNSILLMLCQYQEHSCQVSATFFSEKAHKKSKWVFAHGPHRIGCFLLEQVVIICRVIIIVRQIRIIAIL